MILMVLLAIVLGMLIANMFKEVCGCKNLIEGQCGGAGCPQYSGGCELVH